MLLFGIIEMGLMFVRWQTVSNAAREGARTAIVFRSTCDAATVEANEVRPRVESYLAAAGITLQDPQNDIDVMGICDQTAGATSSVEVTFQFNFLVLPGFAKGISPTIPLVGRSVMRNEGT
jgi:Flp pilus assembly protein TadG